MPAPPTATPLIPAPHRLIVLLAALVAFGPLSIDMYLPSLPAIASDLHALESQVQMTIGVFLAGLCLGMLLYGPLSDRFGRRRLLLGGIVLYLLASVGCALATQIGHLLFWRFVQALGGAAAAVLARTLVRDLFPVSEAARVLSLMHLVTMLATLAAPLLGGYLMLLAGWRVLFGALIVFAGVCLIAVLWKIPETLPPEKRSDSVWQAFRAYGQMAVQPLAIGYILCMGLCFGGMFAFITASPFVYIDYFGISPLAYAWLFGLNIFGVILVTLLNARWVRRSGPGPLLSSGTAMAALAGVALLAVGFSGLGGLPALVVAVVCYVSVTGLLGANCLASLLAAFPRQAGAVAGLAVSCQFGLGMVCSALVGVLYDGTPMPMCLIMGVCGIGSLMALQFARHREVRA